VDHDRRSLGTLSHPDRLVRAFDMETGRELRRIAYPYGPRAWAMDPGGRWLGGVGRERSLEGEFLGLSRVRPKDPIATVGASVTRNLGREEWYRYLGDVPYRPTFPELEREE
jgi:hypothetical protein